jgi:hypothetical protein
MWLALTSTRAPTWEAQPDGSTRLGSTPHVGGAAGCGSMGRELGPTWEMQRALDGRRARPPDVESAAGCSSRSRRLGSHLGRAGQARRLDFGSVPTWEAAGCGSCSRRLGSHLGRAAGRVDSTWLGPPTWDVFRAHVDSALSRRRSGMWLDGRVDSTFGRRSGMWLALTSTRLPPGTRSQARRLDLTRPPRGRRSGMCLRSRRLGSHLGRAAGCGSICAASSAPRGR